MSMKSRMSASVPRRPSQILFIYLIFGVKPAKTSCTLLLMFFFLLQNPAMELSKYQTLPGKRSKKSELNGNREVDGEYLSPVQLSPVHSHDQDYTLSEFLLHQSKWGAWSLFHFLCSYLLHCEEILLSILNSDSECCGTLDLMQELLVWTLLMAGTSYLR